MRTNRFLQIVVLSVFLVFTSYAQDPKPTVTPTPPNVVGEVTIKDAKANKDPIYQKFRNLSELPNSFGGEYASVNNLVLKRDAATFTLRSGDVYFLSSLEGKTTGAVFFGDGEMSLTPPTKEEKRMLNVFTNSTELKETFSKLVMFFTDKTVEEIKSSPNAKINTAGSQAAAARDAFKEKESQLRNEFRYNIYRRILTDVYSTDRPGFFVSFIEGKRYSKLVYQQDPLGIEEVSPEQVMLLNYNNEDGGIWTAYHLADEYKKGTATSSADRRLFDLINHDIDVAIRGEKLIAKDVATMQMLVPGQRVLPIDLFPFLRVKKITDEDGNDLDFIQEDKTKDAGLAVILPKAKEVKKPFKLTFEYEGTNALIDVGAGNFILVARTNWYPNNGGTQFGDRATFDITFHYPKKYVMIGTGELVDGPKEEEDLKVERWSTKGVEMAVAGFNYGNFKKKELKDEATGYTLEVYANSELPGYFKEFIRDVGDFEARGGTTFTTLGAANTVSGMGNVLNQAQNSVRVYDAFFGKLPHKRIAMTQQPAGNFGQAWPTLIFMPFTAYFDDTLRVQLYGIRGGTQMFWREVAAHEVAHQWWGHAVGWTSYHDQWMSEGFSQLSASLYIQIVKKDMKEFAEFWEGERRSIVETSPATKGKAPYTIGPVTQGYRLTTAKTGAVTRFLIYPKGGYILHMLRMLMYDKKTGDAAFQKMMTDFIASNYNKDVSTEDFKAIVQKHMTPKMDIDGNKKIDWFFDQWVYGTDVPAYKFEYNVSGTTLSAKITQSGVSNSFVMPVPVYVDYGDGWTLLGAATVSGNSTAELNNIKLPKAPVKVAICAYNDVLYTKLETVKQ